MNSATLLVAIAYGFIWLAVLAYLLFLGRKLRRLEQELEQLDARQSHKSKEALVITPPTCDKSAHITDP